MPYTPPIVASTLAEHDALGLATQAELDALVDGNAYTTFTTTLGASAANPTTGTTGLLQAGRYKRVGKQVHATYYFVFGSGMTAGSGTYVFTLPISAVAALTNSSVIGVGRLFDSSATASRNVVVELWGSDHTRCQMRMDTTGLVTAISPWTWAANDELTLDLIYEGA